MPLESAPASRRRRTWSSEMPGVGIWVPRRYTARMKTVNRIFLRSSATLNTFSRLDTGIGPFRIDYFCTEDDSGA